MPLRLSSPSLIPIPSQCPIQTKLVDSSLLTTDEREWINAYHNRVLEKIKPGLVKSGDKRAIAWLERECQPI